MSIATRGQKKWIRPIDACNALGISRMTLVKVAPVLGIRCRQIPGRNGRLFNAADVAAAVAKCEAEEAAQLANPQPLTRRERRHKTARTATV